MNGAEQFRKIAKDYHYRCDFVPVGAGLHLKSGVNAVAEDTLLLTESFTDIAAFQNYHRIIIPESESCAANSLRINSHLLIPEGFPQTAAQLDVLNLSMIALDVTEPRKMDGGLSCMSLRF
jgi:dimethylargininase